MRATAAFRMTGVPTTTLPGAALVAATGTPLRVYEVGIFNTTVTACNLTLVRLTSAGTPGAGVTEAPFHPEKTVDATAYQLYSSTPPSLGGVIRVIPLGAAIGAGGVFTFDAEPIYIPAGTGNGIGWIVTAGTGQICDVYFDWDE